MKKKLNKISVFILTMVFCSSHNVLIFGEDITTATSTAGSTTTATATTVPAESQPASQATGGVLATGGSETTVTTGTQPASGTAAGVQPQGTNMQNYPGQPTGYSQMPGQPGMGGQVYPGGNTPLTPGQQYYPGGTMPLNQMQPPAPEPIEQVNEGSSEAAVPATPISEKELAEGVKVDKEQDRISLDLKGIDINELLKILSLKMGVTIVPSKNVSGRVNIFLNNLTFQDALDVILVSQNFACDRTENIINIMTEAEYEKLYGRKYNEKRKFRSLKLNYAKPATVFNALSQIKSDIGKVIVDEASGTILMIDIGDKITLMEKTAKDLDRPTQTEVFDIKYAKSADIKTHMTSAITPGPGEIFVDDRSSKVVITDLPEKMKKLRRMFNAFDAETKQVYIEAEILQLTLKKEYQRQVNWEKVFRQKWLEGLDLKGTFPVNPSFTPSPGFSTANLQITMSTLAQDNNTEAFKFLETFGDIKIISSPRLAVINNQEAKIMVGSREAYVTQSQSQAESTTVTAENVEFIDVGTKLNLTPAINEDGYITMKIKPEVSSVRETLTTSLGSKIPIVETSEVETTVKVKDGTTIMIAGLVKRDKRKDSTGFPFLSSIPFLGAFFGSRADLDKKTEVIVFITPHIIRGDKILAGTEPETLLPADIIPDDLKRSIVSRIISKEIENTTAVSEQKMLPEFDNLSTLDYFSKVNEKPILDIHGKFKGLKEY